MIGLQIVVVDLQRAIRPCPGEPDHVILVVVDFHANLANRVIVGAHVVHCENVALHLQNVLLSDPVTRFFEYIYTSDYFFVFRSNRPENTE